MGNRKKNLAASRKLLCLLVGAAFLTGSDLAHGIWFICNIRDGFKTARWANAAKAQYNRYQASEHVNRQQLDDCLEAWNILRNSTIDQIQLVIENTPGTSRNGPPGTPGDIIKEAVIEAIKRAIKEAVGEISSNPNEGLPSLTESFVLPPGEFVGTPAFESIPISLSFSNLDITSLKMWTPDLYVGSEGTPPMGFFKAPPMIMIEGTFSNVPMESYPIFAATPAAAAFPMSIYDVGKLAVDITRTDIAGGPMNIRAFHAGVVGRELIALLSIFHPGVDFSKVSIDSQLSLVEITSVDAFAGTISGNFFSSTGTNLPPELIISATQMDASGNVTSVDLDWNALPGSTFNVECSPDLQQFSICPSGQGVTPPFTVVVPPSLEDTGFFRVRELP